MLIYFIFIAILLKNPVILLFAAGSIFYSFVYAQFHFSLPLQLNEIYGKIGPSFYGILMTSNAITVILFTIFLTIITNKINSIINIVFAGIFYLIGFGSFIFIKQLPFFIIST